MNYSDTERMESYLQKLGYKQTKDIKKADIIIFNTCSVRQKAEDRVLGQMKKVHRLKKGKPNLITIIAGCMGRKSSSHFSANKDTLFNKIKEIDIVLKIEELPRLAPLIREINPKIHLQKIKEESFRKTHSSKAQAFIPISNGCDKFCAYCIVPFARGREKSRPIKEILKEAKQLVKNGCKEITLLGQTVNSYGKSKYDKENKTFAHIKGAPFIYLLKQINRLHKKGLKRVRFTSPHPNDMSETLINAMASLETQMPYLHLPVQSGDDRTLKRMNRPYTTEQYRDIIKKLRKKIPDISISTDIIVGFCGETDEEFKNTCKFFKEMKFEHAYLAQYSNRKGTMADKYMKDDVSPEIKKKRWEILNKILKKQSKKALKRFIGKTVNVLVEAQKGKECTGRSEHYKIVRFSSGRNLIGEIVPVKITSAKEWILEGKLI